MTLQQGTALPHQSRTERKEGKDVFSHTKPHPSHISLPLQVIEGSCIVRILISRWFLHQITNQLFGMPFLVMYSSTILVIKESYTEWFVVLSGVKNCSPSTQPTVVQINIYLNRCCVELMTEYASASSSDHSKLLVARRKTCSVSRWYSLPKTKRLLGILTNPELRFAAVS